MAAWMKGDGVEEKSFNLTVAEVGSKDVGRRLARIDPKVARDCQMQTGDALKTSSEKTELRNKDNIVLCGAMHCTYLFTINVYYIVDCNFPRLIKDQEACSKSLLSSIHCL